MFVGVLFSCRSFAHLHSGQDKGLWGFSAAHEHLRALSSCSSFSSSQWSQSQTFCRSQLQTHCWSGHAWDRKEDRDTGIRTFCSTKFCLHTQTGQRQDKKRSYKDRYSNDGVSSGLEVLVFPNQSWANTAPGWPVAIILRSGTVFPRKAVLRNTNSREALKHY